MRLFAHSACRPRVTDEDIASLALYPKRRRVVRAELQPNTPRVVVATGALTQSDTGGRREQHTA